VHLPLLEPGGLRDDRRGKAAPVHWRKWHGEGLAVLVMGITPQRATQTGFDLHGGSRAVGGPNGTTSGQGSPWPCSPPVNPAPAKETSPATRIHRCHEHPRRRDQAAALLRPPSILHVAVEIEQQPARTRHTG
jgi:hypothetical protein